MSKKEIKQLAILECKITILEREFAILKIDSIQILLIENEIAILKKKIISITSKVKKRGFLLV